MSVVWSLSHDHVHIDDGNRSVVPVRPGSVPDGSGRLDVLRSQPGVVVEFDAAPEPPTGICEATAAIASLLFDQDTRVWLSASADCKAIRGYLRGRTQSMQVAEPTLADFAIISRPGERAPLGSFFSGTDDYPHRSTTLIVQVDRIEREGSWCLSGPGLRERTRLGVSGLGSRFLSEWAWNAGLNPRGVDVILACGPRCCFLPRTTRIDEQPSRA